MRETKAVTELESGTFEAVGEASRTFKVLVAGPMMVSLAAIASMLSSYEELEVLSGHAHDVEETVRKIRGHKPVVVVIDAFTRKALNHLNQIAAGIREHAPRTQALVLTHLADPHFARDVVRGGYFSYVLKSDTVANFAHALVEVGHGRQYLSQRLAHDLVNLTLSEEKEVLSNRELEVLALVAKGHTNSEIGEILHLSVRTVEAYRSQIHMKLGVDRRWELFEAARERGLLGLGVGES